MNDKFFRSMSALTTVSDVIARTDKILGKTTAMSLAFEQSTAILRGARIASDYASRLNPILDSNEWLKRNTLSTTKNFASGALAYNSTVNFPKVPTIPAWTTNLANPAYNALKNISALNNWNGIISATTNSATKNMSHVLAGFDIWNKTSNNFSEASRIGESIMRFNTNVNHLYNYINDFDEDEDFQLDAEGQLNAALTYDFENVAEIDKIGIIYVTQHILDTFSVMAENFKNGKDKELFSKWMIEFTDELKSTGIRVNVVRVLFFFILPLLSISDFISEDAPINNTYITEARFDCTTTAIKMLRDNPDRRYKVKFTIPLGANLSVLEERDKWIKVKFISQGIFYKGWTQNSDIKH